MKLTIESYGTTYTVETKNDDVSMEQYVDFFNNMLLSIGFHQDTILDGFKEFIEGKEEV